MTWKRFGAARAALAMVLAAGVLFADVDTSRAATFVVTNPNDSGPGSLREAIVQANSTPGFDTILFDIAIPTNTDQEPDQSVTILLESELPPITDRVVIDATTEQPGYAEVGRPVVEVRGQLGFVSDVEMPVMDGLVFDAGSGLSTVQGLSFTQFAQAIVLLSDDNSVRLNWVGLGADEVSRPNITGIRVEGGGNTIGRGNVIVHNEEDGVSITGTNNVVVGNLIGIDHEDSPAGNETGVYMGITAGNNRIGGADPLDRNVISDNDTGVYSDSTTVQNVILGNYIGTDSSGTTAMGNGTGIELDDSPATIGGTTPGARNLISGNFFAGFGATGIEVFNSSGTVIQGNFIGTDATGTQRLGNSGGIVIQGGSNYLIGGTEPGAGNVISGNGVPSEGFIFENGIEVSDVTGLTVQGNIIGATASGDVALPNRVGVELDFTLDVLIGGGEPGAANVISGNIEDGIQDRGTDTRIEGNFLGVTRNGAPLGNQGSGVRIEGVPTPVLTDVGEGGFTP
ncbi:MAG TPA: hypothetical protein VHF91_01300, partial [Acidimicrobiales bacterium]|nr:hypothetical protein [Acidimicrobiales bacterium]